MELGGGTPGTRVVSLTNISVSFGVRPPFGCALVASQLGHSIATGGELEECVGGRGVIQVVVLIAELSGW